MALTEYQTQEQATRLFTAKLRAERLAREKQTSPEAKSKIKHIVIRYKGRQSAARGRLRAALLFSALSVALWTVV